MSPSWNNKSTLSSEAWVTWELTREPTPLAFKDFSKRLRAVSGRYRPTVMHFE